MSGRSPKETKGAPARRRARPRPALPRPGVVPVQERARESVRAILEAAFDVFTDAGWDAATTEAICRRAGVGPATLFRYFPDKAALLAGVADYAWAREGAVLASVVSGAFELPFEGAAALIVRSALDTFLRLSRLHSAFMDQIGPFRLNERYRKIFDEIEEVVKHLIDRDWHGVLRVEDAEVSAFILVRGLGFVMETAAEAHPNWIESGRLERAMVEHVVRLLRETRQSTLAP